MKLNCLVGGFLWMLFGPSPVLGQSASELPGMQTVQKHLQISDAELKLQWTNFVADAVLVSQGWFLVDELKKNQIPQASPVFQSGDIGVQILDFDIIPQEDVLFYPLETGQWVGVNRESTLNARKDNYIINARAYLRQQ